MFGGGPNTDVIELYKEFKENENAQEFILHKMGSSDDLKLHIYQWLFHRKGNTLSWKNRAPILQKQTKQLFLIWVKIGLIKKGSNNSYRLIK